MSIPGFTHPGQTAVDPDAAAAPLGTPGPGTKYLERLRSAQIVTEAPTSEKSVLRWCCRRRLELVDLAQTLLLGGQRIYIAERNQTVRLCKVRTVTAKAVPTSSTGESCFSPRHRQPAMDRRCPMQRQAFSDGATYRPSRAASGPLPPPT